MSLLNPGALTEYEGGPSRERRSRGYVRVREPANGFFIAGSSLGGLNGIYGRVQESNLRFLASLRDRQVQLCYRHDKSGWLMALVEAPCGRKFGADGGEDGDGDEWQRGYDDEESWGT